VWLAVSGAPTTARVGNHRLVAFWTTDDPGWLRFATCAVGFVPPFALDGGNDPKRVSAIFQDAARLLHGVIFVHQLVQVALLSDEFYAAHHSNDPGRNDNDMLSSHTLSFQS
jgi:hypothetical protein